MDTTAKTYSWLVLDTGETIQLEYKPEPQDEHKTFKIDHPDLGTFAVKYLKEE